MRPEPDIQMSRGLLSFEVWTTEGQVLAFLSLASCQAGTAAATTPQTLAQFVGLHRAALDRIVAAKVLAGARHPVVLMARDLVAPAMAGASPQRLRAGADRPAADGIPGPAFAAVAAVATGAAIEAIAAPE